MVAVAVPAATCGGSLTPLITMGLIGLGCVLGALIMVPKRTHKRAIKVFGATLLLLMLDGAIFTYAFAEDGYPVGDRCTMHCNAVAAGAESWWVALAYGCYC